MQFFYFFFLSSKLRLLVLFLKGNKAFQNYLHKIYVVMETIQVSQCGSVCQALLLSITYFAIYLIVLWKIHSMQRCQMPCYAFVFFPFDSFEVWIKTYISPFMIPIAVKYWIFHWISKRDLSFNLWSSLHFQKKGEFIIRLAYAPIILEVAAKEIKGIHR